VCGRKVTLPGTPSSPKILSFKANVTFLAHTLRPTRVPIGLEGCVRQWYNPAHMCSLRERK